MLGFVYLTCTHDDASTSSGPKITRGTNVHTPGNLTTGNPNEWKFDKSHSSVLWQTSYVGASGLLTGRFNQFGLHEVTDPKAIDYITAAQPLPDSSWAFYEKAYHLESYITEHHFDRMGKAVVMLAFLYLYFNVNEYLVPAFKMKKPEEAHLTQLFAGDYAPMFWFAIVVGMLIPITILITKAGRKPTFVFIAGIMVVVGAWFKRYLIVTPTLLHPFLPMQDVPDRFKHYFPSWQEWAIAMGSLAGAMLIITLFARIFPIIPIHETISGHDEQAEQLI